MVLLNNDGQRKKPEETSHLLTTDSMIQSLRNRYRDWSESYLPKPLDTARCIGDLLIVISEMGKELTKYIEVTDVHIEKFEDMEKEIERLKSEVNELMNSREDYIPEPEEIMSPRVFD